MKRQFVFVALLATILTGAFAKDRKVEITGVLLNEGKDLYFAQVDFTDIGLGITKYKFYKDEDWDPEVALEYFEKTWGFWFFLNKNLDPSIRSL